MKSATIIVLLAIIAVAVADVWSYCDPKQTGYILQLESVTLTPSPPASGKPFNVKLKGKNSAAVAAPTAHVHVDYAGVALFDGDVNLCDAPGVKCPLAAGPVSLDITQTIPDIAPPGGPYTGQIRATDGGKVLSCINFNFEMQ
jgi:hypothetical protein